MNNDSILDKYDEMDCAEVQLSFSKDNGPIIQEIVKSVDDKMVGVSENIPLAEYNKESPMQSYCLKLLDEMISDADTFIEFKSIVEGKMLPLYRGLRSQEHARRDTEMPTRAPPCARRRSLVSVALPMVGLFG